MCALCSIPLYTFDFKVLLLLLFRVFIRFGCCTMCHACYSIYLFSVFHLLPLAQLKVFAKDIKINWMAVAVSLSFSSFSYRPFEKSVYYFDFFSLQKLRYNSNWTTFCFCWTRSFIAKGNENKESEKRMRRKWNELKAYNGMKLPWNVQRKCHTNAVFIHNSKRTHWTLQLLNWFLIAVCSMKVEKRTPFELISFRSWLKTL